MAKKKLPKKDLTPTGVVPPTERVTWLLEHVWGGNRSQMARDIGVSHSVLAKIASGTQSAGRRILGAIAAHPKVNPTWLLTGHGEPLLASSTAAPAEGWPLPISRQLLWLRPREQRDFFTGETFPVAGALYRETRYWLRVLPANSLVQHPFLSVRPYDLLLMETDPAFWATAEQIDQRICGVLRPGELQPRLGQFAINDEPETGWRGLEFDAFDTQLELAIRRKKAAAELEAQAEKRAMRPRDSATRSPPPAKQRPYVFPPPLEKVEVQHVVSACVALIRLFP